MFVWETKENTERGRLIILLEIYSRRNITIYCCLPRRNKILGQLSTATTPVVANSISCQSGNYHLTLYTLCVSWIIFFFFLNIHLHALKYFSVKNKNKRKPFVYFILLKLLWHATHDTWYSAYYSQCLSRYWLQFIMAKQKFNSNTTLPHNYYSIQTTIIQLNLFHSLKVIFFFFSNKKGIKREMI